MVDNLERLKALAFKDQVSINDLDQNLQEKINNSTTQVQSDWNETDSESMAFIKNKPTIKQYTTITTEKINQLFE